MTAGILKDNTRVDSLGLKAGDKIIMMGTHAKEVARLHDIETRAQVAKQNYAKCAVSVSSILANLQMHQTLHTWSEISMCLSFPVCLNRP